MKADQNSRSRNEDLYRMIQDIFVELLSADIEGFHWHIQNSLGNLGKYFEMDYAYICKYDFDKRILKDIYMWQREGLPHAEKSIEFFSFQLEDSMIEGHRNGHKFYIDDVSTFDETSIIRRVLEENGIKGLLTIPFYHEGVCTGFFGLHSIGNHRKIIEEELVILEGFTRSFLHLLRKSRLELDLKEMKNQLEGVLDQQKDLVLRILSDGTIIYRNKALKEFFSSHDLFIGNNLFKEENQAFGALALSFREKFGSSDADAFLEWNMVTKRGDIKWIRWEAQVIGKKDDLKIYQATGVDITELKMTYDALAMEKDKLSYTIEASHLGVWEWNLKKDHLSYNRRYLEMIGYEDKKINFEVSEWENLIHPDDWKNVREILSGTISGENETFQMEYRLRHREGHYIWIHDTGKVMIYDSDGSPMIMFGTHYDITTIKEEQLERKAILKAVETSPVMVVITDEKGKIRYVNQYVEEVSGYKKEELLGKNPRIFQSGYHDEVFYKELWTALLQEGVWNGRFRNKRKDGSLYWEEASLSAVFNDEGVLYGYVGIKDDSTERLRLEELLQRSEEQLRLSVEGAEIGAWDWNMESGVSKYSKQWKAILGYEDDEVEESFEGWRKLWHPEEAGMVEHALKSYLEGKSETYEVIHRLRHKDGTYRWILARGRIIPEEVSKKGRFVGIHMDITSRIAIEEELKETNQKLAIAMQEAQSANALKSAFLANVSHEIRTPITAVLGFAYLLQREEMLSDAGHKNVEHIVRGGEHLLGLISDVVDLSKIEAGSQDMHELQFKLGSLLEDIDIMISQQAEKKGISLQIEMPRTDYLLEGDLLKIRQILLNLVGNAVKYTEKGSVSLMVEFTKNTASELLVQFLVKDTGIGVKEEDQEKIFEIFYRNTYGRRISGSGLGLQISKKYAKILGGDITLNSEYGKGSTFKFYVPLKLIEASIEENAHEVEISSRMSKVYDTEKGKVFDAMKQLPSISSEYLMNIKKYVEEGDLDALEKEFANIRDFAPDTASYLEDLLEQFDYQKILEWVQSQERVR